MNLFTFFDQIEGYYGEYQNPKVKQVVKSYVESEHKNDKLKEILKAVFYFHEARFGAPCIATIEKALKSAKYEKGQSDTKKYVETNTKRWDFDKDEIPEEERQENLSKLKNLFPDKKFEP